MIGDIISGIGSVVGGLINSSSARDIAAQNIANQQLFAKNAIQWKVADAAKAGIHPLFALGAQTNSFANVAGDTSLGDAIQNAGQSIGRAADAVATADERAISKKADMLKLENMGLQNDILRAELASKVQRQSGAMVAPPVPSAASRYQIPGQGATVMPSPLVKVKPAELTPGEPGKEFMMPTANPSVQLYRTEDGWSPAPPEQLAESIEDNAFLQAQWAINNIIKPMFLGGGGVGPIGVGPPGSVFDMGYDGVYRWRDVSKPLDFGEKFRRYRDYYYRK